MLSATWTSSAIHVEPNLRIPVVPTGTPSFTTPPILRVLDVAFRDQCTGRNMRVGLRELGFTLLIGK